MSDERNKALFERLGMKVDDDPGSYERGVVAITRLIHNPAAVGTLTLVLLKRPGEDRIRHSRAVAFKDDEVPEHEVLMLAALAGGMHAMTRLSPEEKAALGDPAPEPRTALSLALESWLAERAAREEQAAGILDRLVDLLGAQADHLARRLVR